MNGYQKIVKDSRREVREVARALLSGWWILALCALGATLIAFALCIIQTPTYRSTAVLYVTSGAEGNAQSAYQGALASQQRVTSYISLIGSHAVLSRAISSSGLDMTEAEAAKSLKATARPQSVLIDLSADSSSQETATKLVDAVSTAMVEYTAELETPSGGGSPLAKLTVVSPGSSSGDQVSPVVGRNLTIAFVAGLVVGLVLVAVRARFDNRVVSGRELESLEASPPILATIPPKADSKDLRPFVDFDSGGSLDAESFRKLRTSLDFVNVDAPMKTILVTSPSEGEGKTTIVLNLAAALAESERRVLVIEGDLRRPVLARRLGLQGVVGLSDALGGTGVAADYVQPSGFPGLDLLVCGSIPPNPSELLSSERMRTIVGGLRESYDYILIDSPPVRPVTDPVVLASWVDGCVIVVRSKVTRVPEFASCFSQLSAVKATILGVVVNDVESENAEYGYAAYSAARESNDENLSMSRI